MASLGRSFKPSYFSSASRRPAAPARSLSNMSISSDLSPSSLDIRSEDVALSRRPSPGPTVDSPNAPRSPQHYLRSSTGTRSSPRSPNADEAPSLSSFAKLTPTRSQPITIELPAPRKTSSAPVYTPPAPLSARGDLPGGYFPLHEEQARVYRPHPFQLDATKARMKSIQRASKESPSDIQPYSSAVGKEDAGPATTNVPPAKADRAAEIPQLNMRNLRRSEPDSTSSTPVASYMPHGDRSSPLPMGKYYPSNYERRKDDKKRNSRRPKTSAPVTSGSIRSEPQTPNVNPTSNVSHSRNESEAKRRLQQYQRDMIAQATIALNRGAINEAALGPIRSLGFANIIKPSKPRLAPLGSPGPVTPMELEDSDHGYLEVHGTARAQVELSHATKSGEAQTSQEGDISPVAAAELGPCTL